MNTEKTNKYIELEQDAYMEDHGYYYAARGHIQGEVETSTVYVRWKILAEYDPAEFDESCACNWDEPYSIEHDDKGYLDGYVIS